ncbi:hypothetical protein [Tengunoibacter tsumagoiensis]|uniref:Uncharacterized protein n=1 Tax=Tengunoibacter tsumagoiensis TaxID=2014871 RepID=A0A402AA01_9CHLR|nr:hypothetical protein [Tengunoibacter tsumagoiensis]GCE16007.1 hypothetical protein KTT_58660 [Tengunoibacter tsumagoiensis]
MRPTAGGLHICAFDQGCGVLLVDVESETTVRCDRDGNPQYYCLAGQHIFSVDAEGNTYLSDGFAVLEIYPSVREPRSASRQGLTDG